MAVLDDDLTLALLGGQERGLAQQLLDVRGAGALEALDELVQPSGAQRQAAGVQVDEAPELGGVGQRQLDRLVDAAWAGSTAGRARTVSTVAS